MPTDTVAWTCNSVWNVQNTPNITAFITDWIKGFVPFWHPKWIHWKTQHPFLLIALLSPKCDYIISTEMEMGFKEDCTLPPADSLLFVLPTNASSFSDGVTSGWSLLPLGANADDFLAPLNWQPLTQWTASQNAMLFVFQGFQWLHLIR